MSEIETNEPGGFNRRTAIKGAAWAVPVIAAAVAAPMASASVAPAALAITPNYGLTVAGAGIGAGFDLTNTGAEAWTGTISVTESLAWGGLVGGLLGGVLYGGWTAGSVLQSVDAGITTGGFSRVGGFLSPSGATRPVSFTGTLAPGQSVSWARAISALTLLDLSLIGGLGELVTTLTHDAVITAPTAPDVVTPAASLDWSLLAIG